MASECAPLTAEEAEKICRMPGFIGHALLFLLRVTTQYGDATFSIPPEGIVRACQGWKADITFNEGSQMYEFSVLEVPKALCPVGFYPDIHEVSH